MVAQHVSREMSPWCIPMTTVHTIIGAPKELLDDIASALEEGLWTDFVICAFSAQSPQSLRKYFKGKTSWVLDHITYPIGDEENKSRIDYIARVGDAHGVNVFFDSDEEIVNVFSQPLTPPDGLAVLFPAGTEYKVLSNAIIGVRPRYFPTEPRHKNAFEVIHTKVRSTKT